MRTLAIAALVGLSLGGLSLSGLSPSATPASAQPAAAAATASCSVDDAAITWGFKESFRSYISGTIAHGEWQVADGATYETPSFGFESGTGEYSSLGTGSLDFAGSIRFTGHGGILDTTVANPTLRFDTATSATLLLDVSGTTQDGAEIDEKRVEFAQLDLAAAEVSDADGALAITAAPTTLTDAGAVAFGTYEAGESLDPLTIVFTVSDECVPAGLVAPAALAPAAPAPTAVFYVLIVGVLAVVTAALFAIVRRKGRAN
jgi:large repetitive protein